MAGDRPCLLPLFAVFCRCSLSLSLDIEYRDPAPGILNPSLFRMNLNFQGPDTRKIEVQFFGFTPAGP